MNELTFSTVANILICASKGEKSVITEQHATFETNNLAQWARWMYERQPQVETQLKEMYPHMSVVSYLASREYEGEVKQEWEIVLKDRGVLYLVTSDLTTIEDGRLRSDVYELEKRGKNHYEIISRGGMPEKKIVYNAYPEVENVLFSAIQEIPAYRLLFVTGLIEIERYGGRS